MHCLCSSKSDGERWVGCCNKSSDDTTRSSRKKKKKKVWKKWNPLACLACSGTRIMGCSCCHKSTDESNKSPTRREERKEGKKGIRLSCLVCKRGKEEGKKGCRGTTSCICCKSSDDNKSSRKTKEQKEGKKKKKKKKNRFRCLLCRGSGLRCCLCCVKSPDEHKKSSRKKREPRNGSQLAFLVQNISFTSDSGKHRTAAEDILRIGNGNIAAKVFHFHELAAATRNFNSECLLGEGGFGRVYKGNLEDTNQIVAVKQLDKNGFQGNREFLVEVLMLSLLSHQNLVKLLGYCAEGDQRILVYEYMALGSLEDQLLALSPNNKPMAWNTRMKIALGAAKGLEYLHEVANPPVIYRDFKASNILLDEDYHPKLSDFGLAKIGPIGDQSHVSTRVMGTYGYCAPEYALTGQLTKMSDVYSFGVVFLEIITGRRAIDITKPRHEQQLVQWALPHFKDRTKFVEMADPLLRGNYPIKGMYQALAVAAMCLQEEANIRPQISDVVTALEYLAVPTDSVIEGSKETLSQKLPESNSVLETNKGSKEHTLPELPSLNSKLEINNGSKEPTTQELPARNSELETN